MNDTLNSGESLTPGQQLVSPNGRTIFRFQTDGNVVLVDHAQNDRPLWDSKTNGRPSARLSMQGDGNLVLYDTGNKALWSSNTWDHPGAHLQVQDDGNAVIYRNNAPLWATDTFLFQSGSGGYRGNDGGWVANAVQTAGREVGSAVGAVSKAAGDVTSAIKSVPVVGPALNAVYDWYGGAYVAIVKDIVDGKRIDQVAMNALKGKIADVKAVAPYAQTVISFVPAIGPGVSGAIGAGLALADGMPIDQALLEGVKSSLPGGPLAKMAFDVGAAALAGKPIEQIGLAALPLPEDAKAALSEGLTIARRLANGEHVDSVLIDEAIKQLPPDAQKAARIVNDAAHGKNVADAVANAAIDYALKYAPADVKKQVGNALQTGMAMGHAEDLQAIATKAVQSAPVLQSLAAAGTQALRSNPVAQAARTLAGSASARGFDIGLGLMQHQANETEFRAVRDRLTPDDKKGFDMAVSQHIGHVTNGLPPAPPPVQAAFALTHGMRLAKPSMTVGMMKQALVAHPEAVKEGSTRAIVEIAHARKGWWQRFKEFLGLGG